MRRRALVLCAAACTLVGTLLLACGSSGQDGGSAGPPAPSEAIPREAAPLAARLAEVSDALAAAIDAWERTGDLRRPGVPEAVTLNALYQQRVYRLLAQRRGLASRVLPRLPARHRPFATQVVSALRELGRLTPPTKRRRFKTGPAEPPGALLDHYRRAQRRFGVGAHVLAAVNFVETGFNKLRNNSSSGAQGPMQFIPSTWKAYGMGGDVRDPHDAVHGAANYLRASGAPRNYRRALHAYNPSSLYVNAVLRFARHIARSRRVFLTLYSWQIFVRTTSGEKRLTGPGLGG